MSNWISIKDELPSWFMPVLVPGGMAHLRGKRWFSETSYDEKGDHREITDRVSKWQRHPSYRYDSVSCSSCGENFGPGENGFSHCSSHKGAIPT